MPSDFEGTIQSLFQGRHFNSEKAQVLAITLMMALVYVTVGQHE